MTLVKVNMLIGATACYWKPSHFFLQGCIISNLIGLRLRKGCSGGFSVPVSNILLFPWVPRYKYPVVFFCLLASIQLPEHKFSRSLLLIQSMTRHDKLDMVSPLDVDRVPSDMSMLDKQQGLHNTAEYLNNSSTNGQTPISSLPVRNGNWLGFSSIRWMNEYDWLQQLHHTPNPRTPLSHLNITGRKGNSGPWLGV